MHFHLHFLQEKTLVGKHLDMSMANNLTPELWRNFMPFRKQLLHTIGNDLYSLQVYPPNYFDNYNPATIFTKWAAVEVDLADAVPEHFDVLVIPAGLYAVFVHKGTQHDHSTFNYIFSEWLPNSKEYELDERPHFELLGAKYKNNDPNSEEEIWIPVRSKE